MKKVLLAPAILCSVQAFAQLPVSTSASNRKVVLEEFTGIHCVYCPDGHKRANDLKAAKPAGSVVLVNIHTGGYATPGTGEPDYRTSEGNAIAAISTMGITGYPTGSVNRHIWTGTTAITVNRGLWAGYADSVLAKPSYVNIALEGSLNVTTRVLTVNVEAYYTGNSPLTSNNLTVVLMENNVRGPQTGATAFYPAMVNSDGSYNHNHLLRKVLTTSAMGEVITPTTSGTKITKTYTYTIPALYVNNAAMLGNLELAGFVAEGNTEIMTAAYGPISLTGFANSRDMAANAVVADAEVCEGKLSPTITVYNNGSATITSASIKYDVNGGTASTYAFSGSIKPATSQEITLPVISFTPIASNTLNIKINGVNGSTDENAANDLVSKSGIPLTTKKVNFAWMTMNFTQDQYGSECTWTLYNEATGAVIATDGPFTDLSAAGTALHTKTFTVTPNICYKLVVTDAYGDGVNAGAGVGGYELLEKSTGSIVLSNGMYGKGESKWFKTAATLGINETEMATANLTISPNPGKDVVRTSFTLTEQTNVSIEVVDMLGKVVKTIANKSFAAGSHEVPANISELASGLYLVKLTTEKGSTTERLSVVK